MFSGVSSGLILCCVLLITAVIGSENTINMAGIDLVDSDQECDLGIIVDNKFKFHIQTSHIVNKDSVY